MAATTTGASNREVAQLLVTAQYPLGLCPVHIGIGGTCDHECLPNRLAWVPLVRQLDEYFSSYWRRRVRDRR